MRTSHFLRPIAQAVGQLDDPAFRAVVAKSLGWSLACFVALFALALWTFHRLLALHGWLAWAADILGSVGASLLALWLFLPVAAGIGVLYLDRIALAVERRFYPWLPPGRSAPLLEQVWEGVSVGLKVLALNVAALLLAFTGLGLIFGWLIAAYAIGRSLFVAVAMRRMPRAVAESVYRQCRGVVLAQGAVLALAAYIPMMNLLIPIIGTAAMVHILDSAMADGGAGGRISV